MKVGGGLMRSGTTTEDEGGRERGEYLLRFHLRPVVVMSEHAALIGNIPHFVFS